MLRNAPQFGPDVGPGYGKRFRVKQTLGQAEPLPLKVPVSSLGKLLYYSLPGQLTGQEAAAPTRSSMFRQALAAIVAIVALSMTAVAKDPVPQVRTQAPGYYRMVLGEFEITTVSDGTLPLDVSGIMTNTTSEEVRSFFERSREPLPTDVSINAFLVNTGANLVLIDAGAGALLGGKSSGWLVATMPCCEITIERP